MANTSTSTSARRRRESGGNEPSYTPQDENDVKRILGCSSHYYEVLRLKNGCTDEDVKRSYRNLALAVHPDRNKHPNAKRAFEAIKKASDVLLDGAQRKQYDDAINEQVREYHNEFLRRAQAAEEQARWREEEEPYEFRPRPEPRPRPPPTYTPRTYSTAHEGPNYMLGGFLIVFFVILYVAISLYIGSISIGSFSINDQPYSFLKTGQYQLQRKTSGLKVPFYITSNKVNIGSSFERTVERDYLSQLKVNCGLETAYKRRTGSQHLTTPSCGLYRRLG